MEQRLPDEDQGADGAAPSSSARTPRRGMGSHVGRLLIS